MYGIYSNIFQQKTSVLIDRGFFIELNLYIYFTEKSPTKNNLAGLFFNF
jgi:hypothetical protein